MASIYDIARIQAGDPMARAAMNADTARTELNKYRHQAEIIEEYNKAMKKAEEASKKGSLFGLGGSLLGNLLSSGANFLLPGAGAILGPLAAGIGAGVAEKARQDKYDASGDLRKLQKRLKGRKIAEDIGDTADLIEEQEKAALQTTFGTNALMEAILPTLKGKEVEVTDGVSEYIDNSDLTGGEKILQHGESVAGPADLMSREELAKMYESSPLTERFSEEYAANPELVSLLEDDDYKLISSSDGELGLFKEGEGLLNPTDNSGQIKYATDADGTLGHFDFITDEDGQMVETFIPYEPAFGEPHEFISLDDPRLLADDSVSQVADQRIYDDSFFGQQVDEIGESVMPTGEYGGFTTPETRMEYEFLPGISQEAINKSSHLEKLDEFVREKFGVGLADSKLLNNPLALSLIKGFGPQFAQSLLTPEIQTFSADMPQFYNPYGGR